MSRLPRKCLESTYFHVISQGYEKQYIFGEDCFKQKYFELIMSEKEKFDVELLEYCIMGNHVHILLYCKDIKAMSQYMQSVNTKYALFYNMENDRVGYVFRDRFLSEPIMNEKYLYVCMAYIHMNPVYAGIVDAPEEYHYSSYVDYVEKKGIATPSALERLFGDPAGNPNLFRYIHMAGGVGMEYTDDSPRKRLEQSRKIVKYWIERLCFSSESLKDKKVQRFFYLLLLRNGVKIYHIEKILKVDHKRIRAVLERR